MPTTNELLRDAGLSQQIDLSQYSNGVAVRMVAILNRTDSALAALLSNALDRLPAGSVTVERLEVMLTAVRALNLQAYEQVERALTVELEQFAAVEADFHHALFSGAIPGQIQAVFRVAAIAPHQVYSAAMARPFQGRLLREWSKKLADDRLTRVREATRVGFLEGRTVADIVRDLRGSRELQQQDGKLQLSRGELQTVVRTAVQHHAAVARDLFIDANSDLIAAIVWSSTLDSKTSQICRIRDGLKYTATEHKPIGHRVPYGAGPGRIHFNCRSSAQPVTKSWQALGFDFPELTADTRASMDGQVPADLTYRQWLKKQPPDRQDEVLGPTRAKLMRAGRLDPGDLYSPQGKYLTLKQLASRYGAERTRLGI